jgi:hypothetical protein
MSVAEQLRNYSFMKRASVKKKFEHTFPVCGQGRRSKIVKLWIHDQSPSEFLTVGIFFRSTKIAINHLFGITTAHEDSFALSSGQERPVSQSGGQA